MQQIEQLLKLMDDLLSAGYDNSKIVVIPEDSPNSTLQKHFGVSDKIGDIPLKKGIYVYDLNPDYDTNLINQSEVVYHVGVEGEEGGKLYFFAV